MKTTRLQRLHTATKNYLKTIRSIPGNSNSSLKSYATTALLNFAISHAENMEMLLEDLITTPLSSGTPLVGTQLLDLTNITDIAALNATRSKQPGERD